MCAGRHLLEPALPAEETGDDVRCRQAVLARFDRREDAVARQRERQQQLIRQIRAGKGIGFEIADRLRKYLARFDLSWQQLQDAG